jgi:hypothetical protein
MAAPTEPVDQAAEAGRLADLFNNLSQALDDFRLGDHIPPISADESARLKDQAQELEGLSQNFTAQAIGATLQSIQPDLANIKAVTAQATTQLGVLNDVSKVISIATSALTLGAANAAGNPVSIAAAAEGLAQTIVA